MNADREARAPTEPAATGIYPEQALTEKILEAAFAVHNSLGAGFLEKVYANALALELRDKGLSCEQEVSLKVRYKNAVVGDYLADLVVERRVLLELKACSALDPVHEAQILNYPPSFWIERRSVAKLRASETAISKICLLRRT